MNEKEFDTENFDGIRKDSKFLAELVCFISNYANSGEETKEYLQETAEAFRSVLQQFHDQEYVLCALAATISHAAEREFDYVDTLDSVADWLEKLTALPCEWAHHMGDPLMHAQIEAQKRQKGGKADED